MAKIFNNTDKKAFPQENNINPQGWDQTPLYDDTRIARVTDTVGAGIAMAKMGTSIPTPFARVLLFDTAFAQVNALGHDSDSVYGKLVSECLDFLEFIFNFTDRITVKKWNVSDEISNLKNSTSKKHNNLGNSLEKFARDLNVQDIYLFYYENVLIGGSSPFTLVYTSPNWQRNKPITNARGLEGNLLFDNYSSASVLPVPLHNRNKEFRSYLTKYIVAFRNVPGFANTQFYNYIYDNQDRWDNEMNELFVELTGANPYGLDQFVDEYELLRSGSEVDILGLGGVDVLYMAGKKVAPPVGGETIVSDVAPDYEIVSTKTRYNRHYSGGRIPLVLNDYGISSAIYLGGKPWQQGTIVKRNANEALEDRILPGGGNVHHPYLTDADFLEDNLIKMSYPIDSKAFKTLGVEGQYLLPLKPAFFEYFDINDINKIKNLTLKLQDNGSSVDVILTIPVRCSSHPYIELKKTYDTNENIIKVPATPGFSLAVFPSYKIVGSNVPNKYSLMLHDSSEHGQLITNYYAVNDDEIVKIEEKERVIRTPKVSTYVEIDNAFDLIQVSWENATAIIIPNFKEVKPNSVANGITVGIDFGTTNSYVCLSYNSGADPETLEISTGDRQVLTLNNVDLSKGNYGTTYQDSFRGMIAFNQAIDREFAPLLLGKQSDVQFPYRTVTCESSAFAGKGKPMLFGDIDLGFNFMKEIIDLTDVQYNTNIKWDIEQNSNNANNTQVNLTDCENRVKNFCLQVAWMVKNKVMLSDRPASSFTAYLTFPYTMGRTLKTSIEQYWIDAFEKTMGTNNVTIVRSTESIAPYYYMIGNGAKFTKNALNVDIGGGTTDMLFADIENKKFYYNSSLFAGNDIWGDGKQLVKQSRMDNGFIKYFEDLLNQGQLNIDPKRKDAYLKYKKLVKSSADLMSYVFRYDEEFNFISYIKRSKDKLMPVLYTHLGAVVYHIAQVLKAKEMTVPSTVTFSGMGAQYIHLISSKDSDISELVKALLAEFMGYGYKDDDDQMPSDFKVTFQKSPKEVTAQGAMLEDNPALDEIKLYKQKELYVYGIEDAPKHIQYGEASDYKKSALKMFDKFVKDFLQNRDITHYLNRQFEVRFSPDFIKTLQEQAEMGYDLMAKSKRKDEDVEETLFFWPLKNGLYEASKL